MINDYLLWAGDWIAIKWAPRVSPLRHSSPVSVFPWIPYSSLCPASQCATLRITPMIAWSVLCNDPEQRASIIRIFWNKNTAWSQTQSVPPGVRAWVVLIVIYQRAGVTEIFRAELLPGDNYFQTTFKWGSSLWTFPHINIIGSRDRRRQLIIVDHHHLNWEYNCCDKDDHEHF